MKKTPLHYHMSIRLFTDEKAFGPGIARLLELTQKYSSLNKAVGEMGMAYSKAWRILNDSEKALGVKLLERKAGGRGGGGAALTEEGAAILSAYKAFVRESDLLVSQTFEKYFGTMLY